MMTKASAINKIRKALGENGLSDRIMEEFYELSQDPDGAFLHRDLAYVLHRILQSVLMEADVDEITAAAKLTDLYTCKVCTVHIAQVYVRGIVDERREGCFEVLGEVTDEELTQSLARLFEPKLRIKRELTKQISLPKTITKKEALEFQMTHPKAVLVDVRTLSEYEAFHLKGAVLISVNEFLLNPFCLNVSLTTPVLLYCSEGALSHMAALCLVQAGFTEVYSFGLCGPVSS